MGFDYCRLYVGQPMGMASFKKQIISFGYQQVQQVGDPGEWAQRGGILDIFPGTFESPLRVEFSEKQIDSIRTFNPKSFETLDLHSMVVILPRDVRSRISPEAPFESCLDFNEGDAVVHVQYGIGRFLGRERISGSQGTQDAMILEYADGDRLYVPMDQLHLIQKYASLGGRAPTLHKLGGTAWQKAKERASAGVWAYARGLLELQASRMALEGYSFPEDHPWQAPFEESFEYRTTPDQASATAQVKKDMERPQPMDRILLGDVGYGKTEVAIRAAFKAVMEQKQVAVLVPTTLLAYQHFRTFTHRMESYPVQVAMLSRFQSPSAQRHIVEDLAAGRCDIVIGTHRLLSGDVQFKDLGLLVVDEEQRFGVKAKEMLKEFRTQVDVLSMSATPIPRTLYFSLVGVREMSLIMTPPENRHPVDTQLVDESDHSLARWIRKERERDGQVYIVYNRVQSIHRITERVRRLVPEARVGVAHGQMPEAALEKVMLAFIQGELDVLLCTTIIESGIDIPNANTLIVFDAHRFGLAELYQLRGRVGRFDRKAYTYLVIPRKVVATEEARARLEAICKHTALGSGFKIAMEDLKIRGAGNLLGIEQSGHVTAVGFDLYCRLLREVVNRLKTGSKKEGVPA